MSLEKAIKHHAESVNNIASAVIGLEKAIKHHAESENNIASAVIGLEKAINECEVKSLLNPVSEGATVEKRTQPKATKPTKKATKPEKVIQPEKSGAKGSDAEAPAEKPIPEVKFLKEDVQNRLKQIASKITDTSKLFAIIKDLGADQFSGLAEDTYPVLMEQAEALLTAEK